MGFTLTLSLCESAACMKFVFPKVPDLLPGWLMVKCSETNTYLQLPLLVSSLCIQIGQQKITLIEGINNDSWNDCCN